MIDLRSDTATRPTDGMRAAIAAAIVGDEQRREDPTVNELQERVAGLLGQEAALFLPTATLANQIALKLHTRPGDVLVAERYAHVVIYEYGGPAVHAGLMIEPIEGCEGRFGVAELQAATQPSTKAADQRATVLAIENTHNSSGGRCWPLDELEAVAAAARERGLATHLDGARLLNAAVATGDEPSAIGGLFDTVTLCLSKGLGCPLGALLAAPAEVIERAWREKHLFGGAMRQAGIVAAAGVYALDHHVDRLADDHARARRLAEGWHAAGLPVELEQVETNFVQLDVGRLGLVRDEALVRLRERGVGLSSTIHPSVIRAVTHLDVSDDDVDRAIELAPHALGRVQPPDALVDGLDRLVGGAQAEQRSPSVSAAVFRDGEVIWRRALGVADVEGRGRDPRARLPHRLDHKDVHRRLHPPAARRDGARPRRSPADAPPRSAGRADRSRRVGAPERLAARAPGEIWETLRPPSREELIGGLEDAERVLRPGEAWHYSNLAFGLLGEIVARRSETGYEHALRSRVLDPLGLRRTGFDPSGPRATGYFVDPFSDRVTVEHDLAAEGPTAAMGWLWSTVDDLARWADFLATGSDGVLARKSLDEMARVRTMADQATWTLGWGLGLELYRRGERIFVGHGGAMPGFLAGLCVHRPERTGAAVLLNTGARAEPETLALDLAEATLEAWPQSPEPWRPDEGAPGDVAPLLGRWWSEGSELALSWSDGRLRLEVVDGPVGRSVSWLVPEGDDRWRIVEGRELGELLRVVRDDDGTPVKLYVATYPVTRVPAAFAGDAPE